MEYQNKDYASIGKREVFCRYYTNRYGKRIYPRNGHVFHFFVDDVANAKVNKPHQLSMFDEGET